SLDKTLGLSKKIAMDLMGIGNILFKQGMFEDALKYYNRAFSTSEGVGNKKGVKDATEMIDKCLQNLGKR
ncbi:MAG: tetratricopeptide repeat protein, partial [Nitrospirota bacterium]